MTMTKMRDCVEILGDGCQILVKRNGTRIEFAVEMWDCDNRVWANLDLNEFEARRLAEFLEMQAIDASNTAEDERDAIVTRLGTVVDEVFGTQPVMSADAMITMIETRLHEEKP